MKTLILIFSCILLVMPAQTAKAKDYDQQVEEIEKYIARQQHDTEHYYNYRLIELKQRAESEIRLLEIADKPIFSSLAAQARVAEILLGIDNCENSGLLDFEVKPKRIIQDEYKLQGYSEHSLKVSPEWFAAAQSQIAERKSRILAKLEYETAGLKRQKNYALNVALPELEKQLKENLLKPEAKRTKGVVTGILYSADSPSAIIDGQIVHEGDVIHGVKVAKIFKDRVSFVKNGKSWGQKVRQSSEF